MSQHDYDAPAPPTSTPVDYNAVNGALLLIKVISLEPHVPTVNTKPGEQSPAIRADVTVLDGLKRGEVYTDTLIFPKVLQGQLRRSIGRSVLGRLGQGLPKPGQSAPWQLNEATPADMQAADAFLATKASGISSVGAPDTSQAPF